MNFAGLRQLILLFAAHSIGSRALISSSRNEMNCIKYSYLCEIEMSAPLGNWLVCSRNEQVKVFVCGMLWFD